MEKNIIYALQYSALISAQLALTKISFLILSL